MAGLGVDRGDDPVGGHLLGDPPGPGVVAGLDVLAGHQGQQSHGVALFVGELGVLEWPSMRAWASVTRARDQRLLGHGVVPGDDRLGPGVVVVGGEGDLGWLRRPPGGPGGWPR